METNIKKASWNKSHGDSSAQKKGACPTESETQTGSVLKAMWSITSLVLHRNRGKFNKANHLRGPHYFFTGHLNQDSLICYR